MSIAAIMVHVDNDPGTVSRIRLTAGLAQRHDARLIGVSAALPPDYPAEGAYFVTPDFVAQERRDLDASFQKAAETFAAQSRLDASRRAWRADIAVPDDFVAAQSRAADLLVIGRDGSPGAGIVRTVDAGAVVLTSGCPTLVVPPGIDDLKAEHVVIGWKQTREARRAVRDALPLLRQAKHVTLASFGEENSRAEVEDVAAYMRNNGVVAADEVVADIKEPAGPALVHLALDRGADLIVAGAYGHSRLGELIFGGVTRSLLRSSPVCCLLSH